MLRGIEALVIHVFSSLHHFTHTITSDNMGESAAGEQGRHQVVSCYDNNGVIKIIVTWFLTVLESVLRRVRGGEREVMNLQLETHMENQRASWQL